MKIEYSLSFITVFIFQLNLILANLNSYNLQRAIKSGRDKCF